ncbi:hypothetical protein R3P38DRAFT_3187166 [Favolaschia claudopus]|uniref:RanBD1 domain-containing protein n=1 Tax=Favolaschia claudopus TaxID=2862362 RepID=A0AAW0BXE4_9AGAR
MFPVAESFNFVVCGFATLAATVGYAYSRKTRPLPSRAVHQSQTPSGDDDLVAKVAVGSSTRAAPEKPEGFDLPGEQTESTPPSGIVPEKQMDVDSSPEPMAQPASTVDPSPSLPANLSGDKQMDVDLNGVNVVLKAIPEPVSTALVNGNALLKHNSLKRKRTHEPEDTDPDMGYPHNLNSIYPRKRRSGSVSEEASQEVVIAAPVEALELDEAHLVISPVESGTLVDATNGTDPGVNPPSAQGDKPVTKETIVAVPPEAVDATTERFAFPKTPPRITHYPTPRTTPSSPAFAGFAGSSSPFFSSSSFVEKPIWVSSPTAQESIVGASCEPEKPATALAPAAAKPPAPPTQPHSTGEEDEDITLELKGVKLYIKRGEANFSGAMTGNIKLLSHKVTSAKRLLFRREPLWKVSMNVRMQPTVRCTFDAQENILRVALKEMPEKSGSVEGETAGPQTVIYAFKPGRSCRRSDFEEFAQALLAQARQEGQ